MTNLTALAMTLLVSLLGSCDADCPVPTPTEPVCPPVEPPTCGAYPLYPGSSVAYTTDATNRSVAIMSKSDWQALDSWHNRMQAWAKCAELVLITREPR